MRFVLSDIREPLKTYHGVRSNGRGFKAPHNEDKSLNPDRSITHPFLISIFSMIDSIFTPFFQSTDVVFQIFQI